MAKSSGFNPDDLAQAIYEQFSGRSNELGSFFEELANKVRALRARQRPHPIESVDADDGKPLPPIPEPEEIQGPGSTPDIPDGVRAEDGGIEEVPIPDSAVIESGALPVPEEPALPPIDDPFSASRELVRPALGEPIEALPAPDLPPQPEAAEPGQTPEPFAGDPFDFSSALPGIDQGAAPPDALGGLDPGLSSDDPLAVPPTVSDEGGSPAPLPVELTTVVDAALDAPDAPPTPTTAESSTGGITTDSPVDNFDLAPPLPAPVQVVQPDLPRAEPFESIVPDPPAIPDAAMISAPAPTEFVPQQPEILEAAVPGPPPILKDKTEAPKVPDTTEPEPAPAPARVPQLTPLSAIPFPDSPEDEALGAFDDLGRDQSSWQRKATEVMEMQRDMQRCDNARLYRLHAQTHQDRSRYG